MILRRIVETEYGMLSNLIIDGIPEFVLLEPPWRDNARDISCIPPGEYRITLANHSEYGISWLIAPVPDRDPIYIHTGNWLSNTEGCPLIGEFFGWTPDNRSFGVVNSRIARGRLHRMCIDNPQARLSVFNP